MRAGTQFLQCVVSWQGRVVSVHLMGKRGSSANCSALCHHISPAMRSPLRNVEKSPCKEVSEQHKKNMIVGHGHDVKLRRLCPDGGTTNSYAYLQRCNRGVTLGFS